MAKEKKTASNVYVSWPATDISTVVKTHKNYKMNFFGAMTYAHYELSSVALKKEVVNYLKFQDPKHPLILRIKDMHENRFTTIGKYAYILNHGGELPDDIAPKVMSTLVKIITEEESRLASIAAIEKAEKPVEAVTVAVPKVTIQDRIKDRAHEVAADIDGYVDDFVNSNATVKSVEDFVAMFKAADIKSQHARHIRAWYDRVATEVDDASKGTDKYLAESYSHLSKQQIKQFSTLYKNLLKACDMMQEVAKVERAPRIKKPVSQDKLISKLKYKKEEVALGIVSLNPVQLIGAKLVWLYNVRTRKLSRYVAADSDGISVKGTGLLNFSPESAEKTLRKPADTLAEFKKASKVKLRTFLQDLSTLDIPCNGKMNENHIILRVDK